MCELVARNAPVGVQDIIYNPETQGYKLPLDPQKSASNRSVPMSDLLKPSDSPQIKVLNEWLRGLQTRDMDLIAKCLHKDFRNTVHPQSLGKPERTKEEWLEDLVGLLNLWTKREVNYTSCYSCDPLCCS